MGARRDICDQVGYLPRVIEHEDFHCWQLSPSHAIDSIAKLADLCCRVKYGIFGETQALAQTRKLPLFLFSQSRILPHAAKHLGLLCRIVERVGRVGRRAFEFITDAARPGLVGESLGSPQPDYQIRNLLVLLLIPEEKFV